MKRTFPKLHVSRRKLLIAAASVPVAIRQVHLSSAESMQLEAESCDGDLPFSTLRVGGNTMLPTLQEGEILVVDSLVYSERPPDRGDIIVFNPPVISSKPYIKRIVGLPGETIEIGDGSVYINGAILQESYIDEGITSCSGGPCGQQTIPADHVYVLGDNRRNSSDSRSFGTVPIDDILGMVVVPEEISDERSERWRQIVVNSNEMSPYVRNGDQVVLDIRAFDETTPKRGEIVAYPASSDSDAMVISRVIALPGEVLEYKAGKVIIDGYELDEPYAAGLFTDCPTDTCEPIKIGDEDMYVIGDNRGGTSNSVATGLVEMTRIVGRIYRIPGDRTESC